MKRRRLIHWPGAKKRCGGIGILRSFARKGKEAVNRDLELE